MSEQKEENGADFKINISNPGLNSISDCQNRFDIEISNLNYTVRIPASKAVPGSIKAKAPDSAAPKSPFEKLVARHQQGKLLVDKPILQNITGTFKSGRLTAIMGASGAGKTSLLNVLAGEVVPTSNNLIDGQISVNGTPVVAVSDDDKHPSIKKLSGFVFQDDVILSTMTVKEAIEMSAILRLPTTISKEEKAGRVDQLISTLRLNKAQNTVIGSTTVKGISGGERKRTALSMEMVTNPSILFLDEPTSGLDTFTAFNVCDILKSLSRTGRTVIATIHQPSSEIFHLFDDLCLLAEGRVMYWGPVEQVVSHFDALNYKCPTYTNPADFLFMTVLNTEGSTRKKVQKLSAAGEDTNEKSDIEGPTESDEKERGRIQDLLKVWQESPNAKSLEQQVKDCRSRRVSDNNEGQSRISELSKFSKYKADTVTQFRYLFGRAARNALRNKFIVRVRFAQTLFIALLVGLIYLDLPSKSLSQQTQNFAGACFFIAVNMVMGSSIGVLSIFAVEKAVFTREYVNGYYSLPAYFISKIVVELPVQIVFPIMQSLIMYWMVGFNSQPWYAVLVFMTTLVLLSASGNAMGIFFASVFSDLTVALAVTPMVLIPLMIFAGLFVNNGSIPPYFDWIKWLSPIKYGFEALFKNQFSEWSFTQTVNGRKVTVITGNELIAQFGLDDGLTVGHCLLILFGLYCALLLFAFLALKRSVKKRHL